MSYVVSEQTPPPPNPNYLSYWERSLDPFHADAFPKEAASGVMVVVAAIGEFLGQKDKQPRKAGWMLIDWTENPLGFIPDGNEYPGEPEKYIFETGPFGHPCAYLPSYLQWKNRSEGGEHGKV